MRLGSPVLFALVLLNACGQPSEESSRTQIIQGKVDTSWGVSVVLVSDTTLGSCTGTALSSRHVLTASHCVQGGTGKPYVNIYGPGQSKPQPTPIQVTAIDIPEGIDARRLDFQANDQRFADLAVLTLAQPLPSTIQPLSLATEYPGRGATVLAVGAGEHDETLNSGAELRSRNARLFSSQDSSGTIVLDGTATNHGDSGGPILVRTRDGRWQQLGVLNGTVEYKSSILDRFTSVHEARNRAWIQNVIQSR